jgi:hypothetical protein
MYGKNIGSQPTNGVLEIFQINQLMNENEGLNREGAIGSIELQKNPLSALLNRPIGDQNPTGLPNFPDQCTFELDSNKL